MRIELICEICNGSYELPPARARRSRSCSRDCADAVRRLDAAEAFWAKVDRRGPDECWEWSGTRDADGYGRRKGGGVHRYSWTLANGRDPGELLVRHTCDNPPCVNPAHLILGTHEENMADKVRRKRVSRGEASGSAKLTEDQARSAIRRYMAGETLAVLSDDLDVAMSTLSKIIRGDSWAHLDEPRPTRHEGHARGAHHKKSKITDDDVREIRRLVADGMSQREAGERFGLAQPTVSAIVLRTTWKHVEAVSP